MSADDGEENRFLGAESPRRGAQATRYSSAVRSFHVNVTDWMAYPELGQQALDLADIVDAKWVLAIHRKVCRDLERPAGAQRKRDGCCAD